MRATRTARVDAFGMGRRVGKPLVMAVQGITFTIGIEMMLAADIVVAADDCRFCQMEPKRGLAVFGGAHVRYVERAGWGNAMYHLLRADEFGAARARELGFVQEVVPAGEQVAASDRAGRGDLRQRADRDPGDQAWSARLSRVGRTRRLRRDSRDASPHRRLGRLPGGDRVVSGAESAEVRGALGVAVEIDVYRTS